MIPTQAGRLLQINGSHGKDWWEQCYVPTNCDVVLQDPSRSVVVCGIPGSGKSTALERMRQVLGDELLLVPLSTERWLRKADINRLPASHFGFLMESVSRQISLKIEENPALVCALSSLQQEFLRWLLITYTRRRALRVWVERIGFFQLTQLFQIDGEDLFPSFDDPDDLRDQIDETVYLARGLGYRGVAFVLDFVTPIEALLWDCFTGLLQWLEIWQHKGFVLKAAVPLDEEALSDAVSSARDRIIFRRIIWSETQCRQMACRALRYGFDETLTEPAMQTILSVAEGMTDTIQDVFGSHTPDAWIRTCVLLGDELPLSENRAVDGSYLDSLRLALYRQYVHLEYDAEAQGIWRGHTFISLAGQPFRLFEILWHARGLDCREALVDAAGSEANLHTQIRRLRTAIEPIPSTPIYICLESGEYYVPNYARSR